MAKGFTIDGDLVRVVVALMLAAFALVGIFGDGLSPALAVLWLVLVVLALVLGRRPREEDGDASTIRRYRRERMTSWVFVPILGALVILIVAHH